ncbi:MAG: acyltransferase [Sutterella wadsworthensis]|nr:acyltransferase [Sutterella wadsworthensis]
MTWLTRLYDKSVFNAVELTRADASVIKALAILMIVAHNYFLQIVDHPFDAFHPIASFFGHYGVHIFLFMSGYGLTKKALGYVQKHGGISWLDLWKVSLNQIAKIVSLTLVGVSILCLYKYIAWGTLPNVEFFTKYLVFLTFTENLRPGDFGYFVTVWWFMALIVQFYLLFPIIFKGLSRHAYLTLFVGVQCQLLSVALYQPLLDEHVLVYATPIGHMVLFMLGGYLAMGRRLSRWIVLPLVVVLPLTFVDPDFFHLSFVAVTVFLMLTYGLFRERLIASKTLLWIGGMSMFIYIVHGDLRWQIIPVVNDAQNIWLSYIMFMGYVAEVFIFAILAKWLASTTRIMRLQPFRVSPKVADPCVTTVLKPS